MTTTNPANNRYPQILLVYSLFVFAFFLGANVLIKNMYQYAILGSVYELLWLPMLLSLVLVPLLATRILWKAQNKKNLWAIAALLVILGALLTFFGK